MWEKTNSQFLIAEISTDMFSSEPVLVADEGHVMWLEYTWTKQQPTEDIFISFSFLFSLIKILIGQ